MGLGDAPAASFLRSREHLSHAPFPMLAEGGVYETQSPKGVCSPKTSLSLPGTSPQVPFHICGSDFDCSLPLSCPSSALPFFPPSCVPPPPSTIDSPYIAWLSLNSGSSYLSLASSAWETGLPHHPGFSLCWGTFQAFHSAGEHSSPTSPTSPGVSPQGSSPRGLSDRVTLGTVTTQVAGVLPFTLLQARGSK